jgi:hypothetical protein
MSLAVSMLVGSVFPAFFQCTAHQIMPLHDPVAGVQLMAADRQFAFDERFAKLIGVRKAKGHWTGDGWQLAGGDRGKTLEAMLLMSPSDEHRWALDWDVRSDTTQATVSSGIADCRLLDPQREESAQ